MRLVEIQMEGFRGYPACSPINLDYDVVIIFGDNGSGKSSLFNAIEWLLEDDVDLGDTRSANRGDRFRNLFTNCDEPWVELTLSRKEQNRTTTYQVTRRLKVGTFQSSRVSLKDEKLQTASYPNQLLSREALESRGIIYEWPLTYGQGEFEQVFLNRKRLAKFIEVTSGDRGKQLSKLLGYGVLEEYENTIARLLSFLRRHRREQKLETQFRERCAKFGFSAIAENYQEQYGEVPRAVQTLITSVNDFIEEAKESIDDEEPFFFDGLSDLWKEQLQQFQDSSGLTAEELTKVATKLEKAQKTLDRQQELSNFFNSDRQWLNPTEYQLDAVEKQPEIEQYLSELSDLLEKTRGFQDDPEKFKLEQKLSFLEYGLQRISEQDICPFCQQSITGLWEDSQTTVKDHIVHDHKEFLKQHQDYDPVDNLSNRLEQTRQLLQLIDCADSIKQYRQMLVAHFQSLQGHTKTLTGNDISCPDLDRFLSLEHDFSTIQLLIETLDNALRFLDEPEGNRDFVVPDEPSHHISIALQLAVQLAETQQIIKKTITDMNSQYQEARAVFVSKKQDGLRNEVNRLQEQKAQFDLLTDLTELKDQILDLEGIAQDLSTVNEYVQALLDARYTLRKAKETLLQKAIERISDRVNEIYDNMNPDEALNQIIFRSSGEGNVDIIVDDRIAEISDKEPRPQAFLSEGHLNCLGIAIHLALQEIIDSPYDFVIFDDPIYSIDAGHRMRAIDEMFDFAIRTGKQLIIATHDPLFFHYLKEGLRHRHDEIDSRQIYTVTNHSSTQPYIAKDSINVSFLDEAKEKLSQGCNSYELETSYVLMRREIEYICERLLEGKRIAIYGKPYKKLESRLTLLKELEGVDHDDVNKLQQARTICNPAAHYDPKGRETFTVASQVLQDVENFRDKYLSESQSE